jgi:hypothetical protein
MTTLVLLTELRRQGVRFIENCNKLQVISPKGVVLPDTLKVEIRRHKDEILERLRTGGIIPQDVVAIFPGAAVTATDANLGTCSRCASNQWWVSHYGMKVCEHCFPPSSPKLVVARFEGEKEKNAA